MKQNNRRYVIFAGLALLWAVTQLGCQGVQKRHKEVERPGTTRTHSEAVDRPEATAGQDHKTGVRKSGDRQVSESSLTVEQSKGSEPANQGQAKLPRHRVPTINATKSGKITMSGKIKVDGKLDEPAWSQVEPLELEPFGAAPKLQAKVYVFRSGDHLMVGAHLPDKHVWSTQKKRDAEIWREEVFEVFIDPDRDGKNYLEIQINALGTVVDAHFVERFGRGAGSRSEQFDRAVQWNMEGLESAVHVDGTLSDDSDEDRSWSVELQIPIQQIPGVSRRPEAGESWAANFYRFDRPSRKLTHTYAWSKPDNGNFHQIEQFGTFEFTD